MNAEIQELLAPLRGKLIVSCQAYPGEPLRRAEITAAMAQSVVAGGAAAVRVQGVSDITATREGVYITPCAAHARAVAGAGANIVAIDATLRRRLGGESFADALETVHREFPGVAVMADCASLPDAVAAQAAGADLIGTTLAGYTPGYEHAREKTVGPDFAFIEEVLDAVSAPVVVEGRLHHPQDLAKVMRMGAFAACVGTAITHPTTLTRWFTEAIEA